MAALATSVRSSSPPPLAFQGAATRERQREAAAEKKETANSAAQKTIAVIRTFKSKVSVVVPNHASVACIQGLFSQNIEQLEAELKKATGFEEIRPDKDAFGTRYAKMVFPLSFSAASPDFHIAYEPDTQSCKIHGSYRGNLPTWVKCGDSKYWLDKKRGIPTAKAIKGLLMAKLGMNKNNVKSFTSSCLNAQTNLDIIYNVFVGKKGVPEAVADSQTAHLTAELGEMLGIEKIRLISIEEQDFGWPTPTLSSLIDSSRLSKKEMEKFWKHPRILALEKLGLDPKDENFQVLNQTKLIFEPVS